MSYDKYKTVEGVLSRLKADLKEAETEMKEARKMFAFDDVAFYEGRFEVLADTIEMLLSVKKYSDSK